MTLPAITDPSLAEARHSFFTRAGGVSTGPYASLNASLSGGDAREAVLENRARMAAALDARPEALLGLTQTHSATVVTVTAPWAPGEGPRADAMVTRISGLALGIVTADCGPVLFADRRTGIIGAAHAGWRGAVAGILEATVDAMVALGAAREQIATVIGPCIRQASYEVAADLRDAVLAHEGKHARFFAPGRPDRWQFDLAGYCAARLASCGLASIAITEGDTAAEPDRFFSHRRRTLSGGGPIGHQLSAIRCEA